MLYREIIAVCSQIHTKHVYKLCGRKWNFLMLKLLVHIVTTGGTYSDHWAVHIVTIGRYISWPQGGTYSDHWALTG
jgi:hypothetical protein